MIAMNGRSMYGIVCTIVIRRVLNPRDNIHKSKGTHRQLITDKAIITLYSSGKHMVQYLPSTVWCNCKYGDSDGRNDVGHTYFVTLKRQYVIYRTMYTLICTK